MSDAVIIALVAAMPGVLATVVGVVNRRSIAELHIAVNSRLTELLELTAKAARAEGKASAEPTPPVESRP